MFIPNERKTYSNYHMCLKFSLKFTWNFLFPHNPPQWMEILKINTLWNWLYSRSTLRECIRIGELGHKLFIVKSLSDLLANLWTKSWTVSCLWSSQPASHNSFSSSILILGCVYFGIGHSWYQRVCLENHDFHRDFQRADVALYSHRLSSH